MTEIEICTVGGYSEVGANMTAVRVDNEVILFDMGFNLPEIIRLQEEEDTNKDKLTRQQLINNRAAPDDNVIKHWRKMVKGIVLAHCHLDHIGAVPFLAPKYDCPIYGTPFTIEVLHATCRDDRQKLAQPLRVINPNSKVKISEKLTLEFVHVTHSTPQTVIAVLHTPVGAIVYGNDFKLDNYPTLGKKPNYKRFKELGEMGVHTLICDALYSHEGIKTPSENVAATMLEDVMLHTNNEGHLVIATTFASHIARLKEIFRCGKKLNRKIVVLGRSMSKYLGAAEKVNLIKIDKDVDMVKYGTQVRKKLKEIEKNPKDFLVVCTGHQGEPRAILPRMAYAELPYKFRPGDHVIFACKTIPAPINIANRQALEAKLKQRGVRMFKDIHSSGHLSREDHRDFINVLKPKHVIPCQGDVAKLTPLAELCVEMGYDMGKTVHVSHDGKFLFLK
jgi:ribonuclease J